MTHWQERYSRQIRLRCIGPDGQRRLSRGSVLIVGCGALGSHLAGLLTRAGVGRIRLADRDVLELSNLQRQVLFDEDDVAAGWPKAEAAARKLRRVNSSVTIEPHVVDVTPRTIEGLARDVDLILDGTDNFETRYLLNDLSVRDALPWIYGGVIETEGMSLVIRPGQGPCLRCLFPEPPPAGSVPTCDTVGVLNTLPAWIAAIQSTEAVKLLTGSETVNRRLVRINGWTNHLAQLEVAPSPGCPACGARDFQFLDAERGAWVTTLCGRNAVQIAAERDQPLDLSSLRETLHEAGEVSYNGSVLRFRPGDHELLIFPDGRVVVQGTADEAVARTIYARYLG